MYCCDIETFYRRAKNCLEIFSAYVGDKRIEKLIISCRLKPLHIFRGKLKKHKLETHWLDEFGNSLIAKKNKLSVILKDQNIRVESKIGTDLFGCRSIINTIRISKALILSDGILLLYGQDEYFRCFNRSGKRVSALEVEINTLLSILEFTKSKYKKTENYIIYGLPNREIEELIMKEYINE